MNHITITSKNAIYAEAYVLNTLSRKPFFSKAFPQERLALHHSKKLLSILGSLLGTGCVSVLPAKSSLQTYIDMPLARKLMAVPDMVWSALQVMQAKPCINANKAPARPAHMNASQGSPLK